MVQATAINLLNEQQYPSISPALFCEDHLVFQSQDMDQVKEDVAKIFKPHALRIYNKSNGFNSHMYHIPRGSMSLNCLQYHNSVFIDPDRLNDFYLIHIPLTGEAEFSCGNVTFTACQSKAALLSPTLPVTIDWRAGSEQFVLRIERSRIEKHYRQHFGKTANHPIEFHPELSLETTSGQYFLNLINLLQQSIQFNYPQHLHDAAFEQFESTIINALIYGNKSNIEIETSPRTISPYYVKRVEEYIQHNIANTITIETLAEYASVSARTLFNGFQQYRDISPMEYVRALRLDRVRQDLLSDKHSNVTSVAYKWGFTHLGRFSIEYKKRFGESPSATFRYK